MLSTVKIGMRSIITDFQIACLKGLTCRLIWDRLQGNKKQEATNDDNETPPQRQLKITDFYGTPACLTYRTLSTMAAPAPGQSIALMTANPNSPRDEDKIEWIQRLCNGGLCKVL